MGTSALAALLAACATAAPPPAQTSSSASSRSPATLAAPAPEPPTLVVFFTVDQMLPEYFDRYAPQLTGGLGRLYRNGAVFTDAHQDHAITETAPGHASTLSGRFPRSTGIVTNATGVGDSTAPLLGSTGPGASPFRFRGTTLIDWLRASDPRSRALSVSRKDRGAILPLGRAKQQVYWYAYDGRFTTSRYYADTLPGWLQRFNAAQPAAQLAGRAWTLLLPDASYPEPDSVPAESGGTYVTFPHTLPADPAEAARRLPEYPWIDSLTLDVALRGAREMELGSGPQTDLLAVSLSAMDAVGHRYGPDSREVHDMTLRLDRYLGSFLDSLYARVDSTRVVVALTGDHGVAPFPEVRASGAAAAALHVDVAPQLAAVYARLRAAAVDSAAFDWGGELLEIDHDALRAGGIDPDSLVTAFAAELRRVPGIARVDRPANLARADTVRDEVARRWLHMLPADLPVSLVVTLEPYHVWGQTSYAQHGTPHDYDTHVPLILYGTPFRQGRFDGFVRVVDVAPTLARVAGVQPTEALDGCVLEQALR